MPAVVTVLTGVVLGAAATIVPIDTPEGAVRKLEEAFTRKDIEAAVDAKDFDAEARLMLEKLNPAMAKDPEIVKQTAEVLELGFRNELKTDGFPDFTGLTCSLSKPADVAENLVKMVETCVRASGKPSTQNLHAYKSKKGWRIVVVGDAPT